MKLIEAVLKHARRLGLECRWGGLGNLAKQAKDALDALARVRKSIKGEQLSLWDKGKE